MRQVRRKRVRTVTYPSPSTSHALHTNCRIATKYAVQLHPHVWGTSAFAERQPFWLLADRESNDYHQSSAFTFGLKMYLSYSSFSAAEQS